MAHTKTLRPDAKGRVTLGSLIKDATSFHVMVDKKDRIILEPLVEIPAREKWLFDNKAALNQIKAGIGDANAGKVTKKDFSKYLDGKDD